MACWTLAETRNTVACFTESRAILDDLGDLFVQGWKLNHFDLFHKICQGILIETHSRGNTGGARVPRPTLFSTSSGSSDSEFRHG